MKLRVRALDLETGGLLIIVLNEGFAADEGIRSSDRVLIKKGSKEFVGAVNLTEKGIGRGEAGLFEEWSELGFGEGDIVSITPMPKPSSVSAVKKKLNGEELTKSEIYDIIHDITDGELTDTEMTAFVSGVYTRGMSIEEIYNMIRAMVFYGKKLELDSKMVVNKHCIGGVAGNRTTPIVVSIVAAAGLTIPKISSRAITSPSGTADTVETFTNVTFTVEELKKIINKTGACMAWGGSLNLAPADDKIIKIEQPLSINPEEQMLASVMAKMYSVSSTHVIIDIPLGEQAKVKFIAEARHLERRFKNIARKLGIELEVVITDGSQPIGHGVGPALESIDVLHVLKRHRKSPKDLREKSIFLAAKLLELANISDDCTKLATRLLDTGRAYTKFREIVKAQGGNPDIDESKIKVGKFKFHVRSDKKGEICSISNHSIINFAKAAGTPRDKGAGVYIYKHVGENVKKGDKLFTIYSSSQVKLGRAKELLKKEKPFIIK